MNQDLKKRIPTGILYVIVIATAFLYGAIPAIVLLWIFFALSLYEYVSVSAPKWLVPLTVAGHFIVSCGILDTLTLEHLKIVSIVSTIALSANAIYLMTTKKALILNLPAVVSTLFYIILPFFIAILACNLSESYSKILLGSFIIIWLNDAGAYFVGKAIGKRKIFPSVSPGKSWEGWIGGGIVGMIGAAIVAQYFTAINFSEWLNIAAILAVTGLLGDLVESSWKRSHDLKDSSNLFPGHGGFLDRLDSFIYSIPFVTCLFLVFFK